MRLRRHLASYDSHQLLLIQVVVDTRSKQQDIRYLDQQSPINLVHVDQAHSPVTELVVPTEKMVLLLSE